ncbi:MAG: SpoIIE family protein phosphatase [Spirochaetes bacterium]|nr:SpoIIE family protein phosphatase [Spirochaetota bacterium]
MSDRRFPHIVLVPLYAAVLTVVLSGCAYHKKPPVASRGVLDCTGWNFDADGIIPLDGEWEFYWNRLLGPEDFRNAGLEQSRWYIPVPGVWSGMVIDNREIDCDGFATYRLRVLIGRIDGLLALKLQEVNTACTLWVNGRQILSNGRVGTSRDGYVPQNYPKSAVFRPEGGRLELIMQVANYDDVICGIIRSVRLGPERDMARSGNISLAFDLFLFGSLMIMGIYHFGIFAIRKSDRSALYFGSFCLIIAARLVFTSERFIESIFPCMPWGISLRVELFTLLASLFFALFIYALYKEEMSRTVLYIFAVSCAAFGIIVVSTPLYVSIRVLPVFQVIIVAMGLYGLYVLIRAVINRREGALIFIVGFIMIILTLVNDILHSRMIIQTAYLVPFGLFLFIFSQSFILSVRFSKSLTKVEEMTIKLGEYSDNLEDMVEQRTMELEAEKNKLALQNEIMEKELKLARKIQLQLMPQRYPSGAIYSLYRPMHLIGGDYYDFIKFRDAGKIGIFICDVSGHGVPAALVASMLKSILLQAGVKRDDPAELLMYLNGLLFGQTGDNFVTAFYCVINMKERSIVYSNAGHHPPYFLSGNEARMLDRGKSIPLGIVDNEELSWHSKTYRNHEEVLQRDGKIVLYTDGLVEAADTRDYSRFFGGAEMESAMLGMAALPHRDFVEGLFGRLVEFRGSQSFDDDVCIICVEV